MKLRSIALLLSLCVALVINFASSDGDTRTRVITPYCHTNNTLINDLTSCIGSIAEVTRPDHPTYQIIRSFLDGTNILKAATI